MMEIDLTPCQYCGDTGFRRILRYTTACKMCTPEGRALRAEARREALSDAVSEIRKKNPNFLKPELEALRSSLGRA